MRWHVCAQVEEVAPLPGTGVGTFTPSWADRGSREDPAILSAFLPQQGSGADTQSQGAGVLVVKWERPETGRHLQGEGERCSRKLFPQKRTVLPQGGHR